MVAKLLNDATLQAITTDGVFFDVASHGATKFVIVSQMAHADDETFRETALERFTYLVKAVTLSTSGADVKSAADRIQTLLHNGSLTITGYTFLSMRRTERIRYTEVDESNDSRWQHRGGLYEVWADPS